MLKTGSNLCRKYYKGTKKFRLIKNYNVCFYLIQKMYAYKNIAIFTKVDYNVVYMKGHQSLKEDLKNEINQHRKSTRRNRTLFSGF